MLPSRKHYLSTTPLPIDTVIKEDSAIDSALADPRLSSLPPLHLHIHTDTPAAPPRFRRRREHPTSDALTPPASDRRQTCQLPRPRMSSLFADLPCASPDISTRTADHGSCAAGTRLRSSGGPGGMGEYRCGARWLCRNDTSADCSILCCGILFGQSYSSVVRCILRH